MPKLKTRKAALKRYKKTAAGNFLRRHALKDDLYMHVDVKNFQLLFFYNV